MRCFRSFRVPYTTFFYIQTCLRQIAFNQIHKILGIEPLPAGEQPAPPNRKRPFSATEEDGKYVPVLLPDDHT